MTQTSTDNWMESRRGDLEASLRVVVPFGKYQNKSLAWVRQNDGDYLIWLETHVKSPRVLAAVKVVLEHYHESIRRAAGERKALDRWKVQ